MPLLVGKHSKKINELIRSGGFERIMKADLCSEQGQQTVCDVLELHNLVREGCKLAPAKESNPHQRIVSFLEDLNGKVLIHGSMVDGNHRITVLLACILLKIAKPDVAKGLMKPGHDDYLSNNKLPGWDLGDDVTGNDSAMKDSIDKMVKGEKSELITPIALTIYTVAETSAINDVTTLLTQKSIVQGKRVAGTSTPSLARQLEKALRAMNYGNKANIIPTERKSNKLELQVEVSGKTRSVRTSSVMTNKCLPFLNELLVMSNNNELKDIGDTKGTVHELVEEDEKYVAVGEGTSFPSCINEENIWIDLESNGDDPMPRTTFIQSVRSPMVLKSVCDYLGIKYEPKLGREYAEIMRNHPMNLEELDEGERERLATAYGTGDEVKFTGKPNGISTALIITNFLVNLMIADEVSPDGENSKFKVAITNLSKLTTTGYNQQDLTNLICKCDSIRLSENLIQLEIISIR